MTQERIMELTKKLFIVICYLIPAILITLFIFAAVITIVHAVVSFGFYLVGDAFGLIIVAAFFAVFVFNIYRTLRQLMRGQ